MSVLDLPPPDEVMEFLEYVKGGVGPDTAAYACDWTPGQLKRLMADHDFQAAYRHTLNMQIETVEEVVYKLAMRGNTRMIELYLYNRSADRWSPPTQKVKIDKTTHHSVELVGSAVEAVRQAISEQGAIAAIHAGALEARVHDDDE